MKQQEYTKLVQIKKVLKVAHSLSLLDVTITPEWNQATTALYNSPDGASMILHVCPETMKALELWNTQKKLQNNFPHVTAMLHRLMVAVNSRISSINEASKIQIGDWFAVRYSDVDEYYPMIKELYQQKQARQLQTGDTAIEGGNNA